MNKNQLKLSGSFFSMGFLVLMGLLFSQEVNNQENTLPNDSENGIEYVHYIPNVGIDKSYPSSITGDWKALLIDSKPVVQTNNSTITYGSKISLKSYHGKYLVAEHDGNLNANRDAARSLEHFVIINAKNAADRGAVKFGDNITLQGGQGKYVVGEHDGTANANRTKAASLETFIILNPKNLNDRNVINVGTEKVCFKTLHNKYLVAESNGTVNANRTSPSIWETWTINAPETNINSITYGSKITLLSYHNKYLVSEGNGALNANRAAAASLEQFIILNAANPADRGAVKFGDRINLKTAQNKYVVAESDGRANANRDAAGAWEAFIILNQANQSSRNVINVASDKICFKTAHNKFLVAESDGNANANRDAASIWETWRINAKAAPVVVPTSSTSRINWMANINDNTSIAALSIPGTHDSGADYGSSDFVTSPYAKCQDWSITKQLEEGIRYLDVRCRRMGTVFTIHHDAFYQQKNFGNVLNDCKVFLQKNPSETILMRIKEEYSAGPNSESFQAIFRRYKAQYPGIWYDGNSVPNMKTARGKIIILDDNNKLGEGIYFPVVNKEKNQYPPGLQDEYATGDVDKKWNLIKNHLDKAKNGDKNTLYYNHVSATSAPLKSPRDMADACNPKVDNYLSLNGKGRYGVIIMDFPSSSLINNIINTNGEVKALPGVNATYRVEIDACHSDLSNTGTGGRITVAFYSGSTRVGGKYVDNPGDNCLGSDQAFSLTTDKPITKIEVSTNSGDAYYIDELRTFKDGVLAAHHGGDNGNGWCLSTDASDATGDWKNYISGTGGKCVSVVSFNFFQ